MEHEQPPEAPVELASFKGRRRPTHTQGAPYEAGRAAYEQERGRVERLRRLLQLVALCDVWCFEGELEALEGTVRELLAHALERGQPQARAELGTIGPPLGGA